jgi:hypothetical protein
MTVQCSETDFEKATSTGKHTGIDASVVKIQGLPYRFFEKDVKHIFKKFDLADVNPIELPRTRYVSCPCII